MKTAELIDFLNVLLEAERAGARGLGAIGRDAAPEHKGVLGEIAKDEARYCAMLTRHIERLGGTPSRNTGAFFDKLISLDSLDAQLNLLDRGQGWVVRKLQEFIPELDDNDLIADLQEMVATHEQNIDRANALAN